MKKSAIFMSVFFILMFFAVSANAMTYEDVISDYDEKFAIQGPKNIEIYLKNGNAVLTQVEHTSGRYKIRKLSSEEISELKEYIDKHDTDNWNDCLFRWETSFYQYIHEKGDKTTFVAFSDSEYAFIYNELLDVFRDLADNGDNELRYVWADKLRGYQILIPREEKYVNAVWKNGNDFRVYVGQYSNLGWRKFKNGQIGDDVASPDNFIYQKNKVQGEPYNNPWVSKWNSYCVYALHNTKPYGLYLINENNEKTLVKTGRYYSPVVIPNTNFAVCARREHKDASEEEIIKINLKTGEEERLGFEPEEYLRPIAYADGQVIIKRKQGICTYDVTRGTLQYSTPKYYYIDTIFNYGGGMRFLQKAKGDNEYYAVSTDGGNSTVGIFNLKTFSFSTIAEYKGVQFNSMEAWVDEEENKVYVIIKNDLLALPLKNI